MKRWPIFLGLLLLGAGTLVVRLDLGSPNIGNIVQGLGLFVLLFSILRSSGG